MHRVGIMAGMPPPSRAHPAAPPPTRWRAPSDPTAGGGPGARRPYPGDSDLPAGLAGAGPAGAGPAGRPGDRPDPDDDLDDAPDDGKRPRRRLPPGVRSTRVVGLGALLGAVAVLALSSVWSVNGYGGPLAPVLDGPTAARAAAAGGGGAAQAFDAPAGACLTWTGPNAQNLTKIDCDVSHLFEVSGTADLAADYSRTAALPADTAWKQLITDRCTPISLAYLGGMLDPTGRFGVGAIKPTDSGWRAGDRTLRCGLQVVGRSGGLYPTLGKAGAQDQSDVHAAGTCLAVDGGGVGDPVSCAVPHAVEVVGTVNLGIRFPGDVPAGPAQDDALVGACTDLAAQYAGGPTVVADKKLNLFWDTIGAPSWAAGSRRVDCKLGANLPNAPGFAPLSGSVRGTLTIGTTPAAPAPSTIVPGAPVPSATPDPPVPPGGAPQGPPQDGGGTGQPQDGGGAVQPFAPGTGQAPPAMPGQVTRVPGG